MPMPQSQLLKELIDEIDLSKIDKEALVTLLSKAIEPEKLIEIVNRNNDPIIDEAMEKTKSQSRRWVSWADWAGRSTFHKIADNAFASAIRKVWPK